MNESNKIISLSAIGLDSPGLVSRITNRVFELKGNIIDVEEHCRRGLFSIFLIIDFSASTRPAEETISALRCLGEDAGLQVVLGIYEQPELPYLAHKESHMLTILGEDKPGIIAAVSTLLHRHRINIEKCSMIARGNFFSMEMAIDTTRMIIPPDIERTDAMERMKDELKGLCRELNQSVVIQSEDVYRKGKKLVVFDVESTLVQESSLRDFLMRLEGKVRSRGRAEGPGEEEGDESQGLMERVRLLKGIPLSEVERFSEILQLNPGALELIGILKSMGFKIALLSSGFSFVVKKIFEKAGVDYAFSNTLKVDGQGLITGELEEPVIAGESKKEILEFIMTVENLRPEQVIAVGDGSSRSHFIKNVGLSLAFRPDEKSIPTDGILSGDQITSVLYCLGIPKRELMKYLSPP